MCPAVVRLMSCPTILHNRVVIIGLNSDADPIESGLRLKTLPLIETITQRPIRFVDGGEQCEAFKIPVTSSAGPRFVYSIAEATRSP